MACLGDYIFSYEVETIIAGLASLGDDQKYFFEIGS
jgi:hypothetical protein